MMKIASALFTFTRRKLQRGELTFGLPEAVAISLAGIAIAAIAAYDYTHR